MQYRNILLIDDDDDDQEIFLSAMGEVSNSVSCVAISDATEALKKLNEAEITPDVIFLDLNMPKMNGQQFLAEIKKTSHKSIPIIIFSTSSHNTTIQQTKQLGASDFLTKPGSFDELVNMLKKVI